MNEAAAKIQLMRDQQLTYGMRAAAVLGFFAVLGSLSRSFTIGWHNLLFLHIALYVVIVGAVLFNRYLSFAFKAGIIIAIPFLLGVTALIVWGLAAFGLLSLFCFCILASILFGIRAGIASSLISIVIIGIIGACVYTRNLTFQFNSQAYLSSLGAWLSAMIAMMLSAGTIGVALGILNRQMEELAHTLEKQNEDLREKNKLLESEIAERIHAEKERRKLENRLHMAQKMEAFGALAGGVAHDLNNILGSMVSYPDLLLRDLPQESPLRGTLETIKKSGIKAAVIVNDMLTLARGGVTTTSVVNLNSIISDYCMSPEFEQLKFFHQGVEIETRLEQELWNIRGSFFHLSKVIMNLVSNAAEAIPEKGRVVVVTGNRSVRHSIKDHEEIKNGEYAILCVSDTGIGIPHEDLEKIFEPFYTKKTLGRSGTGLGMAVVWSTVKDHEGYITVESIEGSGTKFTVYFPSTNEPLPPVQALFPGAELSGKGESILVIDDVPEQREVAGRILETIGYAVHAVGSGEEAIEYLKQASADLLLLDMLMEPGMDGLETYRKILEIHPGQKALMVTGFSETSRVKEALKLGAGGYVKKPYLMDQIGRAVRAELDRKSQIS
jgi:signal transduction histidine kinase/ActR/RegA family two-component response regulator